MASRFSSSPSTHPEHFDAVITDPRGNVQEIRVKQDQPGTDWIWGAFQMPGAGRFGELHQLWQQT